MQQQSITDRYPLQHNHTMSFYTHFDFESVLSSTHIADELTYIIANV